MARFASETAGGTVTRLRVRVKPGGRQTRILGTHADMLKIEIQAAPERGRANEELCRLLGDRLGLPLSAIDVVAGVTSRDKLVELKGISAAQVVLILAPPQTREK